MMDTHKPADKTSHPLTPSTAEDAERAPAETAALPLPAFQFQQTPPSTPPPARPAAVMALQRTVGNAATLKTVQRWGWFPAQKTIQRDETGGTAPPAADPVQTVLQQFRTGSTLERNTAEIIDSGAARVFYYDQCPPDTRNPEPASSAWRAVLHPITRERLLIQNNAIGSASGNSIFVLRSLNESRVRTLLIHEVNHTMRHDEESHDDAGSFARYRDEFQAYWIAEFANVADLDERARRIKQHILGDYAAIRSAYERNADFKRQVDGHTRPDGNTLNSLRWQEMNEAVSGGRVDRERFFRALRAMSADERNQARTQYNFNRLFSAALGTVDLISAYLLVNNFSEHSVSFISTAADTNQEVSLGHLRQTSPDERARLRSFRPFTLFLQHRLTPEHRQAVESILSEAGS